MQELAGKVVLVTGGGQGLGAAISDVLAEAGMVVAVADIQTGKAEKVAADIRNKDRKALSVRLNVTDEQQAQEAIQEVVSKCGRLDVLINNAGTDVTLPVEELTVADWQRVLTVNLTGPFIMAKYAMAQMKAQGDNQGHIVNIVSTAAKRAWANASVYHASKWGLLGLSHALHVEGRAQGIKVTAVISGGMRTPFLLDRFPDIDPTNLQDPRNVADTIRYVLTQPQETVIPEVMVIPMKETSWP